MNCYFLYHQSQFSSARTLHLSLTLHTPRANLTFQKFINKASQLNEQRCESFLDTPVEITTPPSLRNAFNKCMRTTGSNTDLSYCQRSLEFPQDRVVLEVSLPLFLVFILLKKNKVFLCRLGRSYFKAISISLYFLAPDSHC